MANHPEIQSKLHRELVDKFPDEANIYQKETMDLSYLDAIIRETMRLMPMIPGKCKSLDDVLIYNRQCGVRRSAGTIFCRGC